MNKKGFQLTLETVLKIVLAIICISFLIYLGYKIYDSFSGSEVTKKASTFVKEFESKINAFKSSDLTEMTYMGFPPQDWYLKSFNVLKEGHPANQCVGKFTSCLCICFETDCSGKLYSCKGFKDAVVIDYTYVDEVYSQIVAGEPLSMETYKYPGIIKLNAITELKIIKKDSAIKISPNVGSGSAGEGSGGGRGGGF